MLLLILPSFIGLFSLAFQSILVSNNRFIITKTQILSIIKERDLAEKLLFFFFFFLEEKKILFLKRKNFLKQKKNREKQTSIDIKETNQRTTTGEKNQKMTPFFKKYFWNIFQKLFSKGVCLIDSLIQENKFEKNLKKNLKKGPKNDFSPVVSLICFCYVN